MINRLGGIGSISFVLLVCALVLPVRAEIARDIPLDNVEAHRRYQDAKLAAGQEADLALEYSDLLRKNPENAYAHLHYARALDPTTDYDKVVEHFQKAIELDPKMFWGHYSLGTLFLSAKQLAPAERELLEAAKLRPEHAETQYNLAYLYMLMGKKEECQRCAERALALKPEFKEARELLERVEGKYYGLRRNSGWPLVVAGILMAIVLNFTLLRRRYKKYQTSTDAFEYAREHSVRRGERGRSGARRVPDDSPSPPREPRPRPRR